MTIALYVAKPDRSDLDETPPYTDALARDAPASECWARAKRIARARDWLRPHGKLSVRFSDGIHIVVDETNGVGYPL